MILIGITGRAGAGKDTAADYLCKAHYFIKLSCAGPLKQMLSVAGFPEPADRDAKELLVDGYDFSWRQAAQRLGTEWGRALDEDIWVKMLRAQILRMAAPVTNPDNARFAISDIRFENEATMIRELGGIIIHLTGRAVDLGQNAGHSSEKGIRFSDEDWMIDNTGTKESLYVDLAHVMSVLSKHG